MIETKVPKDIRKFKGKAIGPFSFRQIVCIIIAIIVDMTVYQNFIKGSDMSSDNSIIILMLCAIPILIFSFEPSGMKMEVYLRDVVYKNFLYPAKRRIRTEIISEKKTASDKESNTIGVKEQKRIQNEYKKAIKEHPEWKRYT